MGIANGLQRLRLPDWLCRFLMALGIIFWCLMAAYAVLVAFTFANYATKAQLDRIEIGMSKAEVIAILGRPDFTDDEERLFYFWVWGAPDPGRLVFDVDGRLKRGPCNDLLNLRTNLEGKRT